MMLLPERIRSDARAAKVEALWQSNVSVTSPPYDLPWPVWDMTPTLVRMLQLLKGSGELVLGLETIEQSLARRGPGVKAEAGSAQMLLLAARDGSPRFARQLTKLWEAWGHMGLAAHVAVDGRDLGQALFKRDKELRVLLVLGEPALVKFLLGLAS